MTTHFYYPNKELQEELTCISKALVAPGKGILAADESSAVMGKRFQLRVTQPEAIFGLDGTTRSIEHPVDHQFLAA